MKVSRTRLATFVVAAGFIALGPGWARIEGGSALVQRWDMFHRRGIGICDAEFLDGHTASPMPLDRFALLGVTRQTAPGILRRMDRQSDVDDVGRRLCGALGRGADVRIRARCATSTGWTVTHDAARNACTDPRKAAPDGD